MTTIEASIWVGEDEYKITAQAVSPTVAMNQVLRARRRLLKELKKEE